MVTEVACGVLDSANPRPGSSRKHKAIKISHKASGQGRGRSGGALRGLGLGGKESEK